MKISSQYPKLVLTAFILATTGLACNSDNNNSSGGSNQNAPTPTLYSKYGGEPTIQKIVDDVAVAVMADPEVAPFFAVVNSPGHDTDDRLKSCLDLQFTALFGGPATYPNVSHFRNAPADGYACEDMTTAHADLAITSSVFDKFMVDLAVVLRANGVTDEDINAIAPALIGLKPQIVTR